MQTFLGKPRYFVRHDGWRWGREWWGVWDGARGRWVGEPKYTDEGEAQVEARELNERG